MTAVGRDSVEREETLIRNHAQPQLDRVSRYRLHAPSSTSTNKGRAAILVTDHFPQLTSPAACDIAAGKTALPYDAPDLPQAKYIALFYSAGWCGPCHQFTPDLVDFYKEMKPKHPEFEIVFMSRDTGQNAIEKYMSEMGMPWPAVRYSGAKSDRALTKYAGRGIPDLVLLNEKGEVLSDSYAGKGYLGPHKVMNDLKKLLNDFLRQRGATGDRE